MKHFIFYAVCFWTLFATYSCADKSNKKIMKTPVIDRSLFFGNPEISSGKLSPTGEFITFMKEYDGIMNVWIKRFDESFDDARPLTKSERPLYGYFWTYDGKYILYVKDYDGDENMNVFAVNPNEVVEAGEVPESRNLTPAKDVTARIFHVSQKDPDLFMIGLNDRDKAWHDLYSLRISTGELKLLYKNTNRITGYEFDWDDQLRLLTSTDEAGTSAILKVNGNSTESIYETTVQENAYVVGWNKDNSKFYLVSNKGDVDLSTLYLMDYQTKEIEKVESDPEGRVDFGGLSLNRNTREVIATSYVDDKRRYYWKDEVREAHYKFLEDKFPGRTVSFISSTIDYSKFLIAVSGDKYAGESWFYDTQTKELIHQYTPRPELKEVEEYLAAMKPVSYKSSDGLEIPGYLTLPVGVEAKNLPLVVLVHGGPKGPRDYWGYDAQAQFLANRGYAVLQPNFRASGGYGKSFLNAGDLEWGKLMQDDITWGVQYLIDEGIADEKRVGIMGGSYGGYATLAGLAFTPDLYACGVDIVGPSNIFTLLESVPAYWEAGRAFLYGMVGDPATEEGEKRIREASPLFSADKIEKPLLIIQGANDPRVKKAEADQIVMALRDKGHDVAYLLADDEGHGFSKPLNRMAMYAEVEKFLAEQLSGRHQKNMSADVEKALTKLRVDIDEVDYKPAAETQIISELPEISNLFNEGAEKLSVKIEQGDQEFEMSTARTVSKKADGWKVSEHTTGAQGEMKDEVVYDKKFNVLVRTLHQADRKIEMKYTPNGIDIDAAGKKMKIEMTGASLSTSAGFEYIIAGINPVVFPLYTQIPEVATQKAKKVIVDHAGEEEVSGVKCRKVSITAVENDRDVVTVWVAKETSLPQKIVQVSPAMNNAVITTVLER